MRHPPCKHNSAEWSRPSRPLRTTIRVDLRVDTPPVLLPFPAPTHPLFPQGQYIIPDTNILLHCVHPLCGRVTDTKTDVLETQSFTGIILLQTVLDELRNRSLPLYNRMRTMAKGQNKRLYTFHNDFRMETYIVRNPGESINDRNDRGIYLSSDCSDWISNTRSGAVVQGTFSVDISGIESSSP